MHRLVTGLAGPHVQDSLLPEVLDALCRDAGLNFSFELIDTTMAPSFDFTSAIEERARRGWTGISVAGTLEFAAPGLVSGRLDRHAERAGAANLLVFDDRVSGCNTNLSGFLQCWRSATENAKPGAVALAGANGVGCSIAAALCDLGACDVAIWDEKPDRARKAAETIGGVTRAVSSGEWQTVTRDATGLVNATSTGAHNQPGIAFHESAIYGQKWALDTVCRPVNTRFMTIARESGLYCITGFEVLVHAAIESFSALTGITADHEQAIRNFRPLQQPAA